MLRKRPIRSSTPQTAAGTRKIQAPIYKREGKENGPGAIAGVGTAASMTSASRAMSSLYLFGPLLTVRDTRNKLRCAPQSQNRFPLPVGKSMLGRNSIRDGFPGNSNKIRIGIDALEEVSPRNLIPVADVSRCQAGLVAVARIGNYTSRRGRGPSFLAFGGVYLWNTLAFIPGEVPNAFDVSSYIMEIYPVFYRTRYPSLLPIVVHKFS